MTGDGRFALVQDHVEAFDVANAVDLSHYATNSFDAVLVFAPLCSSRTG